MDKETIIELTLEQLPDIAPGGLKVAELHGGGSDRRYYRLKGDSISLIFSQYGTERAENSLFAEHSVFLTGLGVRVPRTLACDSQNRRLWMEDLGDDDLWSFRESDWESVRRPLYEASLVEVAKLHSLTEVEFIEPPILNPRLDEKLYRWEFDYFVENFVGRLSGASEDDIRRVRNSAELKRLRVELAARPRCLVHRDFQSRNILVKDGQPALIDYQGMRFGLAEYDVASLLYDPYVAISTEQREELIRFAESRSPTPDFRGQLLGCAVQRLMQALGAYGFLGLVKMNSAFLRHVPRGLANLREVAVEQGAMPVLEPVLRLRREE